MSTPEFSREVIDDLESGTERIVATLAALDDADLRAPSALPGWSRAHVATHPDGPPPRVPPWPPAPAGFPAA